MSTYCRVLTKSDSPSNYDYSLLILGDIASGKSSLINAMINVVLGRTSNELLIAKPLQDYPQVSAYFNINYSDVTYPIIFELSGELTNWKKIRIIEIPFIKSEMKYTSKSPIDKLSCSLTLALEYLNSITAIGITQKSSESRNLASHHVMYSAISKVFSSEYLARNCCFFFTFYCGSIHYNTDWVRIKPAMKTKFNNMLFQYSAEDYKTNIKIIKKSNKCLEKMKKCFRKTFKFLVSREGISREFLLKRILNVDYGSDEERKDEVIKKNAEEKLRWEEEKKNLIEDVNMHRKNWEEMKKDNIKLNAEIKGLNIKFSEISSELKSAKNKLIEAEKNKKVLSGEKTKLSKDNSDLKKQISDLQLEVSEIISQKDNLKKNYLEALKQIDDFKKNQEREAIKIEKISNLFSNLDFFLDELERKIAFPVCEICKICSDYICDFHETKIYLCTIHFRLHLGENHHLLPIYDTIIDDPNLNARLVDCVLKVHDNKNRVITFFGNVMKETKILHGKITERFDALAKQLSSMKTTGKPRGFDFGTINIFDEVIQENILIDWFFDNLRKSTSL